MPLISMLAGGARRCAPNVAGRFSDLLMAIPQGALDQRPDEFALLHGFPRPVAIAVVAIRLSAGRAGAEAAVDAAFPIPRAVLRASASPRAGLRASGCRAFPNF